MDFRQHVRGHLPPLAIAREPEIVDELAQHLHDIYQEARAAGAAHDIAIARALAALPRPDELAREIESASRALPALITDRWRGAAAEPPVSTGSMSMFSDLRQDLRYAVRMLASAPAFTLIV